MKTITETVHKNTSKVYIFALVTAVILKKTFCPHAHDFYYVQVNNCSRA